MGIKCIHCETKQIPVYDPLQETRKKRRRRKKKERKKNLSTLSIELSIDYRLVNIQYSFPRATSSYSILIFLFSLFYYPLLCFTRLHDLPRLLFPPFSPFLTPLLHAQSIEQITTSIESIDNR